MMKKQSFYQVLKIVLSYVLVAALSATAAFWVADTWGTDKLSILEGVIDQRFVGDADKTQMEDAAAQAMVDALGDKWSYYISAEAYAAHKENRDNSFVGVGITIQLREDGTGFDIPLVEPAGPAQRAGILPGDVLIIVEGESVAGLTTDQLKSKVQGKEGTQVELTVLREEQQHIFTVTREKILVQVAEGEMLEGNIGLITIKNFNSNCKEQTVETIEALIDQGAKGLIFDVRNNGGGYLDELTDLLDYLLPEGTLVQMEDKSGKQSQITSDDSCLELPMAVLMNGRSYSAAELFAAALEEYGWAVTVGEKTSGKGYYQNTIDLPDGSAVNLSTGKYLTPNGVNLQEVGGLIPNVEVPVEQEMDAKIYAHILSPEEDIQIQAAVKALDLG